MKTERDLRSLLVSIDRRSYPAYKDSYGSYRFRDYILHIDHVQGDPFASPSNLTIEVPGNTAAFPKEYYSLKHRRIALEDYLIRLFHQEAEKFSFKARGSGKSGAIFTCSPGQEILERTACHIEENGTVLYRLEVGFPANGRTINSGELIKILYDFLPDIVKTCLLYHKDNLLEVKAIRKAIDLSDDQDYIRKELEKRELVAFIADGSILPRKSGVSALPMKNALPFTSPSSMRIELDLPHKGITCGMGIKRGITLIVGGGYHGKSTLLKALEIGVYNHIAGDGREYVLTESSAMKIRAEDGRSVHNTDISMFIRDLPNGIDTTCFSTEDASGSTSQAANVSEALESGSMTLLIDEDTCATNFMIRDSLMQEVIHRNQEPITPFIERIRPFWEKNGISTVLVAGSFGAFFNIADSIIQMDNYRTVDITEKAHKAADAYISKMPKEQHPEEGTKNQEAKASEPKAQELMPNFSRKPLPIRKFDLKGRIKTKTLGFDGFSIERETVDLRCLEQLSESAQTNALCRIVVYLSKHLFDGKRTMRECVDRLEKLLQQDPEAVLCENSYVVPGLAIPRRQEIFFCLDRCRFIDIKLP